MNNVQSLKKFEYKDCEKTKKVKNTNLQFMCKECSGKDVVKVEKLWKRYGEKYVFEGINLNIYYGEKVCLSGRNGCGKSTLLKIIAGIDKEYDGIVKIGESVKIGYIPQEIAFENDDASIFNFFIEGSNMSETECRNKLARFGFRGEEVFKKVREFIWWRKS